jgi:hypothetical protein
VIVIHPAFDVAVQAQLAPVVTVVEPVPPLAPMSWVVGAIENVHAVVAAAACDTVNV